MTLDEFYDVCREVYEKTGYKTDIFYGNGADYCAYVLRGEGGHLYNGSEIGATEEQIEAFFDIYETGIAEGWACDPAIYAERTIGTPEQMPLVYGSSPSTMSWCSFTWSNALSALQNAAGDNFTIEMTTWPSNAGFYDAARTGADDPAVSVVPKAGLGRHLSAADRAVLLRYPRLLRLPDPEPSSSGIPKDLDEAARIDGCSYFGIYLRIILPLIVPALITAGIFSFMWRWDDFLSALLYVKESVRYPASLALKLFCDPVLPLTTALCSPCPPCPLSRRLRSSSCSRNIWSRASQRPV